MSTIECFFFSYRCPVFFTVMFQAVATPGVPGGLTVHANATLNIYLEALCGTCGDKQLRLELAIKSISDILFLANSRPKN